MLVTKISRMVLCMFALIASVSVAIAQTTQGGIVGTVRDQKGAEIAGPKSW